MQKLGQHFLKNNEVLQGIVRTLDVRAGETIIEIGPGHGELTMPVARAADGLNAAIIAIEKDHSLIATLEGSAQKERAGLLTIIEGDALKLLPKIAGDQRRYKIAGNIPYYITGKLLRIISELGNKPERVVLLIQTEVAQRICATPPEMNRLAASVQFWAEPNIAAFVPRHDFSPPPDVDSAVIVLSKRSPSENIDPTLYYRAVRGIFSQPRKTITNNITSTATGIVKKEYVIEVLHKMGVAPNDRPQNLTIEKVVAIAKEEWWG